MAPRSLFLQVVRAGFGLIFQAMWLHVDFGVNGGEICRDLILHSFVVELLGMDLTHLDNDLAWKRIIQ